MPRTTPSHPRTPGARGAWIATATLAALLAGAAWAQAPAPLRVVTTTAMVADTLREVGGACVDVVHLMGPGIDPHLYRASAGDVDRLGRAELIVHNGLGLEGQLGAVLDRLGSRVPALALAGAAAERAAGTAASTGADAALLEGEDAYEGRPDPHLWLDAALWSHAAAAAADAIAALRPDCGDAVRGRAAAHAERLLALDAWAAASVTSVPEARRTLVTSHDAFRYFGRAYGLAVHGVEGISTESEASIADIRATADLVLDTGVPAIFVESTISPRTIEAVLAAARDRGGEVAIGGSLYGDAMGEAGTPEGTLIGMLRHNVITIVTALGGEVAPWPEALADWAAGWDLP
ncbi:MAG: metal ABC transporter solute-binding protein, Zn/Mn family [Trueperaceae bacterium]